MNAEDYAQEAVTRADHAAQVTSQRRDLGFPDDPMFEIMFAQVQATLAVYNEIKEQNAADFFNEE